MPRLISVANMKGGVGKSTSAMFISELLALADPERGRPARRVLCVDLDPQANLSIMLLTAGTVDDLKTSRRTINGAIERMAKGEDPKASEYLKTRATDIAALRSGHANTGALDLIPASPGVRFAEMKLEWSAGRDANSIAEMRSRVKVKLLSFLADVEADYEVVVFDCPPALTALAQAAIAMSDIVVCPVVPDFISWKSTVNFLETISSQDDADFNLVDRSRILTLISKFRSRSRHDRVVSQLRDAYQAQGLKVIGPTVPLKDQFVAASERQFHNSERSEVNKYRGVLDRLRQIVRTIEDHGVNR